MGRQRAFDIMVMHWLLNPLEFLLDFFIKQVDLASIVSLCRQTLLSRVRHPPSDASKAARVCCVSCLNAGPPVVSIWEVAPVHTYYINRQTCVRQLCLSRALCWSPRCQGCLFPSRSSFDYRSGGDFCALGDTVYYLSGILPTALI